MGRPSSYKEEYAEQAYKLCLLGLTDKQLADFFNTSEQTINAWKKAQPDFLESLKRAKEEADATVVESLFKKTQGFHYQEEVMTKMGPDMMTKYHVPDTTAIIFWLKNRQPQYWRDKREMDHTTKGDKITAIERVIVKND